MNSVLYFDYAATTPVDDRVKSAMMDSLSRDGVFGNASSESHDYGFAAQILIENARTKIAQCIAASLEDIIFTSGATEANNLAILGIARANQHKGRHIIASAIEHQSVLEPCKILQSEGFTLTLIEPTSEGMITTEALIAALRDDTILVSIMMVNNEIGSLQPIASLGACLKAHSAYFHVDAVQAAGKFAIDVNALHVDALTLSAHKIYGPKGSGILYLKQSKKIALQPLCYGGGQELGLRPGTLANHQIVGMSEALALAEELRIEEMTRLSQLKAKLWEGLQVLKNIHLNGSLQSSSPHILNLSFSGVDGETLLIALSHFALSSGSACAGASVEPSHVLLAIGCHRLLAASSIRFSLGRYTTESEIEQLIHGVVNAVNQLRG